MLTLDNLELDCKGVGTTELNLSADKMSIKSEIVGALILTGDVRDVKINHSGLGLISAYNLKTEKLSLDADGIGAAEVYATKELNINSKGVGGIKYKGNPEVKNIRNEGIGTVQQDD
jgi:hypothetical protein